MARVTRLHEDYKNPFWTEDENIEMATRVLVRGDFSDLLGNSLLLPDLKALERALFGVVYPSLGRNLGIQRSAGRFAMQYILRSFQLIEFPILDQGRRGQSPRVSHEGEKLLATARGRTSE